MDRRSVVATHFVFALDLVTVKAAFAQAVDTPPTTPAGTVARAYGPSSGGLAWRRSSNDRGVRGYEISRDGVALGGRTQQHR